MGNWWNTCPLNNHLLVLLSVLLVVQSLKCSCTKSIQKWVDKIICYDSPGQHSCDCTAQGVFCSVLIWSKTQLCWCRLSAVVWLCVTFTDHLIYYLWEWIMVSLTLYTAVRSFSLFLLTWRYGSLFTTKPGYLPYCTVGVSVWVIMLVKSF